MSLHARVVRRALQLVVCMAVFLVIWPAHAAVVRYAVVIGHNRGDAKEVELRYTHEDAQKVFGTLRDLGDFAPENMVLLLDPSAQTIQRVLVTMNDRIRTRQSEGDQTIFSVYYSGHANPIALHVGGEHLSLEMVKQLVSGSAASFRILVLDACRTGTPTRNKGGTRREPYFIELEQPLHSEGAAFLSSSSANEDAQESDELRGSFFTHYFVSGLLGAADENLDGRVSLEESYAYAYAHTLRSTASTWSGTQHPTYEFDTRGRGSVALTRVSRRLQHQGILSFPTARSFLVTRQNAQGPVVAELGEFDRVRSMTLPAGRYFVRGRAPDHLLEGLVDLGPSEEIKIQADQLTRIEYARMVRKGNTDKHVAHGPLVGYSPRTGIAAFPGKNIGHGVRAGYAWAMRWVSVTPYLGYTRTHSDSIAVPTTQDEVDISLSLVRPYDLRRISVGIGVNLGSSWAHQQFHGLANTPPHNSTLLHAGIVGQFSVDIPGGFYLQMELIGQLYAFRQTLGNSSKVLTRAAFALRPFLGIGKHF